MRLYMHQTISLPQLLRPIDGVDINPERIFAQAIGVAWRVDHNGQDGGPALYRAQAAVLVRTLYPGNAERGRRSADNAGDLNGDLQPAQIGEGIVGAGVIVERGGASIRRKVIRTQPVLAQHDAIGWKSSDVLDEARQMESDLRIRRLIAAVSRRHG